MLSAAEAFGATPPERCGLAVALPLDRGAFVADLESGSERDFAQEMLRGRSAERVWAEDGLPLSELCSDLLGVAEDLGVRTVATAGLADLGALFDDREVVTIVAHWRGAALVGADFRDEPRILIEAIRSGQDPLYRDLDRRLPLPRIEAVRALPERRQRTALAELLNEVVIRSERPLPGALASGGGLLVAIDELSLRSRQRAMLDSAFPGQLHPGNRLELRDGLHAPAEIAAQVPRAWRGTIDFAICQSAFLAHAVKNGRAERHIITNLHEVVPDVRLRIQRELYRRLARGGNYTSELIGMFTTIATVRHPVNETGLWQKLRRIWDRETEA